MTDFLVRNPPKYITQIHKDLKEKMIDAVEAAKDFKLKDSVNRQRIFTEVDRLIDRHSCLLTEFYTGLEPPLYIAVSKLSPELVQICMKYGADPLQKFPCSKNGLPKNAHLVANDAYSSKLRKWFNNDQVLEDYYNLYVSVIQAMNQVNSMAASGVAGSSR